MAHPGPPDVNEMAFRIVQAATDDEPDEVPESPQVESGRKGGKARAAALPAARRSEIARHAANERWAASAAD